MVGKSLEFGIKADPLLSHEAHNIPIKFVLITHLLIVWRHDSHRGIIAPASWVVVRTNEKSP